MKTTDEIPAGVIKQTILDRVRYTCSASIGKYALESMRPEVWMDQVTQNLIAMVRFELLGQKRGDVTREVNVTVVPPSQTVSFQSPSSWWQHFKQDWFPNWLLNRFPVQYTVTEKTVQPPSVTKSVSLTIEQTDLYPELDLPFRPNQSPVTIQHFSTPQWRVK